MTAAFETLPLDAGPLNGFERRMARAFRGAIEDWEEVCSALGSWETEHLAVNPLPKTLAQHRAWIDELIAWGELVRRAAVHPSFPDVPLACQIDLRLRHLRDKLAIWHSAMEPSEEDQILKAAFDEP